MKKTLDWELEKRLRLGELGEKIVANYESSRGNKVFLSLDPYDSNKDLWVNDKRCEVKTQIPFFSKNGFSFKKSQINKITSCDRLYIVSVDPGSEQYSHFSELTNRVYIVEEPSKLVIGRTTCSLGEMCYIRISDTKPYFEITDPTAKELLTYYSSLHTSKLIEHV